MSPAAWLAAHPLVFSHLRAMHPYLFLRPYLLYHLAPSGTTECTCTPENILVSPSALQAKQSKFSLCRHVSFSPNLSADPCRQQVCVWRGVACEQGAAGGQQNGSVWSALVHPDSMDAAESSMALAAVTSHCCLRLSGLDSQPHHPVLWTSESQCSLGIPSSLC